MAQALDITYLVGGHVGYIPLRTSGGATGKVASHVDGFFFSILSRSGTVTILPRGFGDGEFGSGFFGGDIDSTLQPNLDLTAYQGPLTRRGARQTISKRGSA